MSSDRPPARASDSPREVARRTRRRGAGPRAAAPAAGQRSDPLRSVRAPAAPRSAPAERPPVTCTSRSHDVIGHLTAQEPGGGRRRRGRRVAAPARSAAGRQRSALPRAGEQEARRRRAPDEPRRSPAPPWNRDRATGRRRPATRTGPLAAAAASSDSVAAPIRKRSGGAPAGSQPSAAATAPRLAGGDVTEPVAQRGQQLQQPGVPQHALGLHAVRPQAAGRRSRDPRPRRAARSCRRRAPPRSAARPPSRPAPPRRAPGCGRAPPRGPPAD